MSLLHRLAARIASLCAAMLAGLALGETRRINVYQPADFAARLT